MYPNGANGETQGEEDGRWTPHKLGRASELRDSSLASGGDTTMFFNLLPRTGLNEEKAEARYVRVGRDDHESSPPLLDRSLTCFRRQRPLAMGVPLSRRASRWIDHDQHAERVPHCLQGTLFGSSVRALHHFSHCSSRSPRRTTRRSRRVSSSLSLA